MFQALFVYTETHMDAEVGRFVGLFYPQLRTLQLGTVVTKRRQERVSEIPGTFLESHCRAQISTRIWGAKIAGQKITVTDQPYVCLLGIKRYWAQ